MLNFYIRIYMYMFIYIDAELIYRLNNKENANSHGNLMILQEDMRYIYFFSEVNSIPPYYRLLGISLS